MAEWQGASAVTSPRVFWSSRVLHCREKAALEDRAEEKGVLSDSVLVCGEMSHESW